MKVQKSTIPTAVSTHRVIRLSHESLTDMPIGLIGVGFLMT